MLVTAPLHYRVISNGLLIPALEEVAGNWKASGSKEWTEALKDEAFAADADEFNPSPLRYYKSIRGLGTVTAMVEPVGRDVGRELLLDVARAGVAADEHALGARGVEADAHDEPGGDSGGLDPQLHPGRVRPNGNDRRDRRGRA